MAGIILPIFLANAGCASRCLFCNQKIVERRQSFPNISSVRLEIERQLKYLKDVPQLAFYGGTFTALPDGLQFELLDMANEYINSGLISGIRLSTRPDAIDREKVLLLKKMNVVVVEIGAQSLVDSVLEINNRCHTVSDVMKSVSLIKEQDIKTGIHLMTGLLGDSEETFLETAAQLVHLSPDYLRIHPTLVLRGTALEKLVANGGYFPQSLSQAILQAAWLKLVGCRQGIEIIRTGIQASDELGSGNIVCGPWHPSFGEMADSFCFYSLMKTFAIVRGENCINVNTADVSKVVGQKRCNVRKFANYGVFLKIVADNSVDKGSLYYGSSKRSLSELLGYYDYYSLRKIAEDLFETTRF